MKVFFSVDYSIPFFVDIARSLQERSHVVEITKNPQCADVVVLLYKNPTDLKKKIKKIRKFSFTIPIITTSVDDKLFRSDKNIFFLNNRLSDASVMNFINCLLDIRHDITHIHWYVSCDHTCLKREIIDIVFVLRKLMRDNEIDIRFVVDGGNDSIFVSGTFSRTLSSFSCFVQYNPRIGFEEVVTIHTRNNDTFSLSPPPHFGYHSYYERYGAAWDEFLVMCLNNNHYRTQAHVLSEINRSFARCATTISTKP